MPRLTNPARRSFTPCPRAGQTGGAPSNPLTPSVSRGPVGLSPETQLWIRTVKRRADQASLILILIAVLWFATASIGASLP